MSGAYPKLIEPKDLTTNELINLDEIIETFDLDVCGSLEDVTTFWAGVKYYDLWRDEEGGSASVHFSGQQIDVTMWNPGGRPCEERPDRERNEWHPVQ